MNPSPRPPEFTALRCGGITLRLITEANRDEIRRQFEALPDASWILREFDRSYLPAFDSEGRRRKWGFAATLDGELAGLSLLGISSWEDARGYTGADTLAPMRGRGVAPGSKPHLFYLGFALLGLNRIETGCFASNRASRRSLEKTPGLVFEGVLREYGRNEAGEFEDERRYAILRRDWEELYRDTKVEVLTGSSE
jgi:RimJ/RimL family protein N-acetyltransferase